MDFYMFQIARDHVGSTVVDEEQDVAIQLSISLAQPLLKDGRSHLSILTAVVVKRKVIDTSKTSRY